MKVNPLMMPQCRLVEYRLFHISESGEVSIGERLRCSPRSLKMTLPNQILSGKGEAQTIMADSCSIGYTHAWILTEGSSSGKE